MGLGTCHHILKDTQLIGELIVGVNGLVIEGHDAVTFLESDAGCRGIGHHTVDLCRDEWTDKRRLGLQHA